jgi:hypothetical protein
MQPGHPQKTFHKNLPFDKKGWHQRTAPLWTDTALSWELLWQDSWLQSFRSVKPDARIYYEVL